MNPGDNSTTNWLCSFRGSPHPLWASLWNKWVIHKRSLSALLEGLEVAVAHCCYIRFPGGFLFKKKSGSLSIYLGRFPRAWNWILNEGNDSKHASIEDLPSAMADALKRWICLAVIAPVFPCQHVVPELVRNEWWFHFYNYVRTHSPISGSRLCSMKYLNSSHT